MSNCTFLESIDVETVLDLYKKKGYKLFTGDYNLNIFGIRSSDMESNTFNDCVGILYQKNGVWTLFKTACTTDAGLYYRLNPMNIKGTGIIAPGQHLSAWKLGKHQGKYEALVQNKPIKVYRDANRDSKLEYVGEAKPEMAGINLHRANATIESKQVDKWSAACVVVANPNDFQQLLAIAKEQVERRGDGFTFTLFEEKDI